MKPSGDLVPWRSQHTSARPHSSAFPGQAALGHVRQAAREEELACFPKQQRHCGEQETVGKEQPGAERCRGTCLFWAAYDIMQEHVCVQSGRVICVCVCVSMCSHERGGVCNHGRVHVCVYNHAGACCVYDHAGMCVCAHAHDRARAWVCVHMIVQGHGCV